MLSPNQVRLHCLDMSDRVGSEFDVREVVVRRGRGHGRNGTWFANLHLRRWPKRSSTKHVRVRSTRLAVNESLITVNTSSWVKEDDGPCEHQSETMFSSHLTLRLSPLCRRTNSLCRASMNVHPNADQPQHHRTAFPILFARATRCLQRVKRNDRLFARTCVLFPSPHAIRQAASGTGIDRDTRARAPPAEVHQPYSPKARTTTPPHDNVIATRCTFTSPTHTVLSPYCARFRPATLRHIDRVRGSWRSIAATLRETPCT